MVRSPTKHEKFWVRNTILFTVGLVVSHQLILSLNDGSLVKFVRLTTESCKIALKEHILEPVTALVKELFDTIQNREEIVSKHDLDQSRFV